MSDNFSPFSPLPPSLDQIWNPENPEASETSYRELLLQSQQRVSSDSSDLVELHSQIGRALGAQGKIAEALLSLKEAELLLKSAQRSTAKMRWLLERGRIHVLERTPSQARPLFVEAWQLASSSGQDSYVIDASLMMAAIEPQKVQQEWIVRAIKLAEESIQQDAKHWLGSLHIALGWKLYEAKQFESALEIFRKALGYFESQGSEREIFQAKWSIGKILRTQGKTEEALAMQNLLLSGLAGSVGNAVSKNGRLYEEIAECLQTLGRVPEAQVYFELAYRELVRDQWVADNQPAALKRLKELGKVKP